MWMLNLEPQQIFRAAVSTLLQSDVLYYILFEGRNLFLIRYWNLTKGKFCYNPVIDNLLQSFDGFMEKMMMAIEEKIRALANQYAQELREKIDARVEEMKEDDKSHYLIYQVLGITDDEGELIDIYQNKGRFLYNYAGAFLEEAAILCFVEAFPNATRHHVPNTIGQRPKQFEIDCLVENDAIEIKWRDATTDGDHITKEHTRIRAIREHGHTPIRIMFYYPNRDQAIRIQETIKSVYAGVGGQYYMGDDAWEYIMARTGIDLKAILTTIAYENMRGVGR